MLCILVCSALEKHCDIKLISYSKLKTWPEVINVFMIPIEYECVKGKTFFETILIKLGREKVWKCMHDKKVIIKIYLNISRKFDLVSQISIFFIISKMFLFLSHNFDLFNPTFWYIISINANWSEVKKVTKMRYNQLTKTNVVFALCSYCNCCLVN